MERGGLRELSSAAPDLRPVMENELEPIIQMLAEARWPWRIHATYDESIGRFLDIFERVHREAPIDQLRWFIDHAETISERNLERIQALGGGIATQHRMAYQGEYYIRRFGVESAKRKPPLRRMLQMGLPVGAGTDGTRVASYHPWTCLWWMVTSKTVGGTTLHDESDRSVAKRRCDFILTAARGSVMKTIAREPSPSVVSQTWPSSVTITLP